MTAMIYLKYRSAKEQNPPAPDRQAVKRHFWGHGRTLYGTNYCLRTAESGIVYLAAPIYWPQRSSSPNGILNHQKQALRRQR